MRPLLFTCAATLIAAASLPAAEDDWMQTPEASAPNQPSHDRSIPPAYASGVEIVTSDEGYCAVTQQNSPHVRPAGSHESSAAVEPESTPVAIGSAQPTYSNPRLQPPSPEITTDVYVYVAS
jgi:hypothetical protein